MSAVTATPRVLILALCNWFGAPRLTCAFRRAGFHVTTFGFPGLLLLRSQSVDDAILVAESASSDELLAALRAAIERSRADVVIPTDDTTVIALQAVAAMARRSGAPDRLLSVLTDSLGEPRHIPTAQSRKLLANLATELGVRQPDNAAVFSELDALEFAKEHQSS